VSVHRRILLSCLAACLSAAVDGSGTGQARAADHPPWCLPARIGLSVGARYPSNTDLRRTYGLVPVVGLRILARSPTRSQVFAGVAFSATSGNPFYHLPASDMGRPARLTLRSLEVGFRSIGALPFSRGKLFVGLAVGYTEVAETMTGIDYYHAAASAKSTGQGLGLKFLCGPEWESADGRWAAGLEASLELMSVDLYYGGQHWSIPLGGPAIRASLALRI
jgi:hypothetical protein